MTSAGSNTRTEVITVSVLQHRLESIVLEATSLSYSPRWRIMFGCLTCLLALVMVAFGARRRLTW